MGGTWTGRVFFLLNIPAKHDPASEFQLSAFCFAKPDAGPNFCFAARP